MHTLLSWSATKTFIALSKFDLLQDRKSLWLSTRSYHFPPPHENSNTTLNSLL